jgi:hypothetical protein
VKRQKPAQRQRKIFPEGKKLLSYPPSYEGPRARVTTIQDGVERYVYEDGTFDPRSTVLTKTNDTFVQVKKEKGKPKVWEKVAEGRSLPRMPISNYVELLQTHVADHESWLMLNRLRAHLPELGVETELGSIAASQSAGPRKQPETADPAAATVA